EGRELRLRDGWEVARTPLGKMPLRPFVRPPRLRMNAVRDELIAGAEDLDRVGFVAFRVARQSELGGPLLRDLVSNPIDPTPFRRRAYTERATPQRRRREFVDLLSKFGIADVNVDEREAGSIHAHAAGENAEP